MIACLALTFLFRFPFLSPTCLLSPPLTSAPVRQVNIITGALTYKEKTARMVMTPIDDVFMLSITSILDFKTVTKIMESGHRCVSVRAVLNRQTRRRFGPGMAHVPPRAQHPPLPPSRIPTFSESRDNIVGVLYVKDLAFIDPDDKTPLESVIKYYNHKIEEVRERATPATARLSLLL